jgi:hypothetical protein
VRSASMTSLSHRDAGDVDLPGRAAQVRSEGSSGGHHLGRAPKRYRRSKTGLMVSDFPELDFRANDNSGVRASEVPAGTKDTGVFRCRSCGEAFEAIVANRVALRRNGRRGELCARCSGWLPAPGNTLADLPGWLLAQLRLADGMDPSALPKVGGPQRLYWWECSRGHLFLERVRNRLHSHAHCETEAMHDCGCPGCRGRRAVPDNNLQVAHPELAARLDSVRALNGYSAAQIPPHGGRAKHLFWCGAVGHPIYRTTAAHALQSRWLGCPGCRAERSSNRDVA